jgi:signal transduction histidine kinase
VREQPQTSERGTRPILRWADICPWPQLRGGRPVQRWDPRLLAWHALVYAILAAATLSTLSKGDDAGQAGIALALSLFLGAWYGYWMVLRQDLMGSSPTARAVYFTVAAALWALLLAVDRNYSILSITGFVQLYGYLSWRSALAGAGLMTLLFATSRGWQGGLGSDEGLRWVGVSAVDVIWSALVLFVSAVFFLFLRDVVRQSAERQRLIDALQAARDELAVAERHAGMLRERERLAAELHDTLTQELTSVVMLLEAAQASLSTGAPTGVERVEQALRAARVSLREVRQVVWSLRPETLERGTLQEALDRLASDLSKHTGITARTLATGEARELPTEVEVTLLRAAQEALANVRRHSGAREVTLTLSFMNDLVVLDVRDDGVGFAPGLLPIRPGIHGGLGLVAMRERVEALHGSLTVESAAGEGTTVVAAIPMEPAVAPTERTEPSDTTVQ